MASYQQEQPGITFKVSKLDLFLGLCYIRNTQVELEEELFMVGENFRQPPQTRLCAWDGVKFAKNN